MRKSLVIVIAVVAVLVAIGGPLTLAILIAKRDARNTELRHMMSHAQEVLARTVSSSNQVHDGIAQLVALGRGDDLTI